MTTWSGTLPTLPAGHVPTGAELAILLAVLAATSDPWTAFGTGANWTANTTNPVLNNGTWDGEYMLVGKLAIVRFSITAGSTTTYGSGSYSITLPVTCKGPTGLPCGVATLMDSSVSTNRLFRSLWQNTTTSMAMGAEDGTRVGNATPFTFAVGDQIAGLCALEVA